MYFSRRNFAQTYVWNGFFYPLNFFFGTHWNPFQLWKEKNKRSGNYLIIKTFQQLIFFFFFFFYIFLKLINFFTMNHAMTILLGIMATKTFCHICTVCQPLWIMICPGLESLRENFSASVGTVACHFRRCITTNPNSHLFLFFLKTTQRWNTLEIISFIFLDLF